MKFNSNIFVLWHVLHISVKPKDSNIFVLWHVLHISVKPKDYLYNVKKL
jgi:hypothetical protein